MSDVAMKTGVLSVPTYRNNFTEVWRGVLFLYYLCSVKRTECTFRASLPYAMVFAMSDTE